MTTHGHCSYHKFKQQNFLKFNFSCEKNSRRKSHYFAFWLSKFLRQSLMIFIIKCFQTTVFIFIVISTTFWPICPPAFFRCLSNSATYTELQTMSFIESTGITSSDSISHNRYKYLVFLYCYSPAVRTEPATSRWLSP